MVVPYLSRQSDILSKSPDLNEDGKSRFWEGVLNGWSLGCDVHQKKFPKVLQKGDLINTEDSRSSGSFFTQVDHLFLANCFNKQAINLTDLSTLKS